MEIKEVTYWKATNKWESLIYDRLSGKAITIEITEKVAKELIKEFDLAKNESDKSDTYSL